MAQGDNIVPASQALVAHIEAEGAEDKTGLLLHTFPW